MAGRQTSSEDSVERVAASPIAQQHDVQLPVDGSHDVSCRCEVRTHPDLLPKGHFADMLWLGCRRLGTWIYGWCICNRKDDKVLPSGEPSRSITEIEETMDIDERQSIRTSRWRLNPTLVLDACNRVNLDQFSEPIELNEVEDGYWELSEAAIKEFLRMADKTLPAPEASPIDEIVVVNEWLEPRKEPTDDRSKSNSGTKPGKESKSTEIAVLGCTKDTVSYPYFTAKGCCTFQPNGCGNHCKRKEDSQLKDREKPRTAKDDETIALFAGGTRPVRAEEMAGRLHSWAQSLKKSTLKKKLRNGQVQGMAKEAVESRLQALESAEADQSAKAERYVQPLPDEPYRPRSLNATVMGRVMKTIVAILIDSGSSLSIVSKRFADRYLRECPTFAYNGPMVTVANTAQVMPEGYVDVSVQIGDSLVKQRFAVFSDLPVDVLLGTDWLYNSKAITDWGQQKLTFPGSKRSVEIKIYAEQKPSALHLVEELVIPPLHGKWAEVVASKKDTLTQIPLATVMITSDPWCAQNRGVITQRSLVKCEMGACKVFLVNTNAFPIRVKKRNTVAIALPDVPGDEHIIPMDEEMYDLDELKVGGEEPLSEIDARKARMLTLSNAFGFGVKGLTADQICTLQEATDMDAISLVGLIGKHRELPGNPVGSVDGMSTHLANYVGCQWKGNSIEKDIPMVNVIRQRDENVSELYTLDSTIGLIRSYFGGTIELDPASCDAANKVVKARRYFTKETNGLEQEWNANSIYVNPPFCELDKWSKKIKYEAGLLNDKKPKEIFVMVPCRETEWMKELLSEATAMLMPHRRTQFWSKKKERIFIRDATVLLYFGPKEKIHNLRQRFQSDYSITLTQGVAVQEAMYVPSDVNPLIEPPEDYDPIDHVSIGAKRNLTDEQRKTLEELIRKYRHIVNPNPGVCRIAGARIDTGNAKPVNLPLRRSSPAQKVEIEKQIKELLDLGMIRPSTSPWAAGIVMAPKPDGTWRFCVDYRELNKVTVRDSYPLPRVDEYLHALEGNTWFSVLDLNSGFWQIPIHLEDVQKTAFLSHAGLYEWIRMPMGWMNSPAVFQRVMDLAFAGMKWRNLLVYIDDVLVMSPSYKKHLEDLEETFKRLENLGMTVKPKKCQFACGELKYLGHLITPEGIKVNPEKVRAIVDMPWPDSPEKMNSFLGLVSYYRDYIERCATVCEPLYVISKMTPKEYPTVPSLEQLMAFDELKAQLTAEDRVLIRPDFNKPFYLQTDASNYGLSAILTQKDSNGKDRVVSYASRTLVKPERKWHSHELEALAAIWGCEHFRPYLIGRRFTLQTDNSAVKWLMQQTKPGRLQRWILRIQEFDFEILHRPGLSNGNADGPSRNPVPFLPEEEEKLEALAYGLPLEPKSMLITAQKCPVYKPEIHRKLMENLKQREAMWDKLSVEERYFHKTMFSGFVSYMNQLDNFKTGGDGQKLMLMESSVFREVFLKAQNEDVVLKRIIDTLNNQTVAGMSVNEQQKIRRSYGLNSDGLLVKYHRWRKEGYAKELAMVPNDYKDELLRLYHTLPHGGHLGGNKMYYRMREVFYWHAISRDCKRYASGCTMCSSRKPPRPMTHGKMVLRETVGPWEHVSYDLLSGFRTSKRGNKLCLVVMCEFTKGVEVIPLKDSNTETIARAMVNEVFYRHGIPRKLHSDQGSNMNIAHVMKNVCDLLGISRSFSTAGHPEGNGLVERFNRFLVQGLYCLMNRLEDDWDLQLPALLFAYRTSIHPTTGETPFFMMHGRDAVGPGELLLSKVKNGKDNHQRYARQVYLDLMEANKRIKERMMMMQRKQKAYYDRYHRKQDVHFSVGNNLQPADLVVIYYQEPHIVGDSTKFKSKWSVPFRVIRKMNNGVNYEVQNVQNPHVKKIVHVSRMRKYQPWIPYVENPLLDHVDLSTPFPGYVTGKDEPKPLLPYEDFEIDKIIDQYDEVNGKVRRTWFLVHWANYPVDAVSWVISTDVRAANVLKAWRSEKKKLSLKRRKLFGMLPSKRPNDFRRDDPFENDAEDNDYDSDAEPEVVISG